VFAAGLGKVDGAREQHHADEEEEDEKAKLTHAGVDSLPEDLQSLRVTRQLEYPKDPDEPDHAKHGKRHGLVVRLAAFFSQERAEGYEVRNDRKQINHVHDVAEECKVIGASGKPDYQLRREPNDADRLDDEERVVLARNVVFHKHFRDDSVAGVGGGVGHVAGVVVAELRQSFKAENNDGQKNNNHGE